MTKKKRSRPLKKFTKKNKPNYRLGDSFGFFED